jgi:hypothetical protein
MRTILATNGMCRRSRKAPKRGSGSSKVYHWLSRRPRMKAHHYRRVGVAGQLRAGEALGERLHQPLDVGLCQIDQHRLGQKEDGPTHPAAQGIHP